MFLSLGAVDKEIDLTYLMIFFFCPSLQNFVPPLDQSGLQKCPDTGLDLFRYRKEIHYPFIYLFNCLWLDNYSTTTSHTHMKT